MKRKGHSNQDGLFFIPKLMIICKSIKLLEMKLLQNTFMQKLLILSNITIFF